MGSGGVINTESHAPVFRETPVNTLWTPLSRLNGWQQRHFSGSDDSASYTDRRIEGWIHT